MKIAVIGAGPAGLTYASLVADGNSVTVLEKAARPGGAVPTNATVGSFQQTDPAGSDTLHLTTAFAMGSTAPGYG